MRLYFMAFILFLAGSFSTAAQDKEDATYGGAAELFRIIYGGSECKLPINASMSKWVDTMVAQIGMERRSRALGVAKQNFDARVSELGDIGACLALRDELAAKGWF